MLKKWILLLAPAMILGLSACASTDDSDGEAADNTTSKATQKCKKVRSTGSNIGRCQK